MFSTVTTVAVFVSSVHALVAHAPSPEKLTVGVIGGKWLCM